MTKKSNRKEKRFKKKIPMPSSLGMVTSSTITDTTTKVIHEDLTNSSDTKENDQSDVNSLNNSPSSTSSSKKSTMSPIAIPLHMTVPIPVVPMCNQYNTLLSDAEAKVSKVMSVPPPSSVSSSCDIPTASTSALAEDSECDVSSTTPSIELCDSPILEKALQKKCSTQHDEEVTAISPGQLTYNGSYQVLKVEPAESTSESVDLAHSCSGTDDALPDSGVEVTPVETVECEVQSEEEDEEITPQRKFPDSFEELILMHFRRELDVAQMVESMDCLNKENQANEAQLASLMEQMSLLTDQKKQLEEITK